MRCFRVPPLLSAIGAVAVYGTVDVAARLALSTLGSRHGWTKTRPGTANSVGFAPLCGGVVVVVLAAAAHATALRRLDWRFMKVDPGAIVLGSLPVALGLVALVAGLQVGVRMEERGLARQFGADWYAYKRATPRFIGRRDRG